MLKMKTINNRQIEKAVGKVKASLSSGHGEISSCILEASLSAISGSLCHIFNFSLPTCSFPDYCKTARVSPIFKE